MTGRGDRRSIDDGTAERLLDGVLAPDDAPPGYRRAAGLVAALRGPASAHELAREELVVASMVEARSPSDHPRRTTMTRARRIQLAAASLAGSLTLMGGLAVAGALPGAAQDVAKNVLGGLGIDVPGPSSSSNGHADTRGRSDSAPNGDTGVGAESNQGGNGKGSTISDLAHTTGASGVDKGAAISSEASDGKSQAGENGGSGPTGPSGPEAGDDHAVDGSQQSDDASDGHSSLGAGNASGGLSHEP